MRVGMVVGTENAGSVPVMGHHLKVRDAEASKLNRSSSICNFGSSGTLRG